MRRWGAIVPAFLCCFILFSKSVRAQSPLSNDPDLCIASPAQSRLVVYGNGVGNIYQEAVESLFKIQLKLKPLLSQAEFDSIKLCVAYNQTNGKILDLFQAFLQRLEESISNFWLYITHEESVPEVLREEARRIEAEINENQYVQDPDLQQHIDEIYLPAINDGKRVVVVPHSQGNFYANQAYRRIFGNHDPVDKFKIVSVANPSSLVGGTGPYTTLTADKVIQAVEFFLPSTLNPNVDNAQPSADQDEHSFIEAYLLPGSHSERQILSHLLSALQLPLVIADRTTPLPDVGSQDRFLDIPTASAGPALFRTVNYLSDATGHLSAAEFGLYRYTLHEGIIPIFTRTVPVVITSFPPFPPTRDIPFSYRVLGLPDERVLYATNPETENTQILLSPEPLPNTPSCTGQPCPLLQ